MAEGTLCNILTVQLQLAEHAECLGAEVGTVWKRLVQCRVVSDEDHLEFVLVWGICRAGYQLGRIALRQ